VSRFVCICIFFLLPAVAPGQTVLVAKLDGMINPTTADYINRCIEKAREQNAECLILQMNTPGGLLESTRAIVSDFLQSEIPIVVYVSPSGAHAGSAGVFITLAANVAAMAPGTNIGAAHPVGLQGQMDSTMAEKATNDAAAFIRSIAENRKRNLKWAEEAVRKSESITETEALKKNVVDLIAKNVGDLLNELDGRRVITATDTVILRTKGARIESLEMGWADRILDLLSDPNIVYILFMLGTYGLMFELYNPGSIFPGVIGVISLILAFYSMHTLPINYAGLALIIFGIILFLLEIKITSHGLLAVGGVISLLSGSLMLMRTQSGLEVIGLSWYVIIVSVVVSTLFFVFLLGLGLKVQRKKPTTGIEGLVGEIGEAYTSLDPEGTVRVHGEFWRAESSSGPVSKGERVRVIEVRDMTLRVERSK
jgi:membrane-bound serine protease (ClpP class)